MYRSSCNSLAHTRNGRGGRMLAGLGLALLLAVTLLPGSAWASPPPPPDAGLPPGISVPPPHPGLLAQACFEQHLQNSARCKSVWCSPASFIWITWEDCDESQLADCMDKANLVFTCCLNPSHPDCPSPAGGGGGNP